MLTNLRGNPVHSNQDIHKFTCASTYRILSQSRQGTALVRCRFAYSIFNHLETVQQPQFLSSSIARGAFLKRPSTPVQKEFVKGQMQTNIPNNVFSLHHLLCAVIWGWVCIDECCFLQALRGEPTNMPRRPPQRSNSAALLRLYSDSTLQHR